MATKQVLIETWNGSTEREKAQELFDKAMNIEDDTLTRFEISITTIRPDHTEKHESVTWASRYEIIEDE